jgi:hypothetical protein
MYQDKDFTGSKSFNEYLKSNLFWEANSKLIFEVFIESYPWLIREMVKNAAEKMLVKMAGSSRKVTEKMVIEFFKLVIPQNQFLGIMDIVETLKTQD